MIFQNQILDFVRCPPLRCGLFAVACSVSALAAGCGQKGPLFLPEAPTMQHLPAAATGLESVTRPVSPASAAK
ncbi:MAG: LPS translocon maturation chaperone LptM [Polaromonas sp.]